MLELELERELGVWDGLLVGRGEVEDMMEQATNWANRYLKYWAVNVEVTVPRSKECEWRSAKGRTVSKFFLQVLSDSCTT